MMSLLSGREDAATGRGAPRVGRAVSIDVGPIRLPGDLTLPPEPAAVVVFAHGSGSSRRSPRNVWVAERLQADGLGTLLFDLLTEDEADDRALVFDIPFLADRLQWAVRWMQESSGLDRPIALFGASTGAGAALVAATRTQAVASVVSRGGRPDLAGEALEYVRAPTLLIVGGADEAVLELNRTAQRRIPGETRLEVVPGATHLFEEPGALERVAELAASWVSAHLPAAEG
jgi:putative phosphoribosyl transferase